MRRCPPSVREPGRIGSLPPGSTRLGEGVVDVAVARRRLAKGAQDRIGLWRAAADTERGDEAGTS